MLTKMYTGYWELRWQRKPRKNPLRFLPPKLAVRFMRGTNSWSRSVSIPALEGILTEAALLEIVAQPAFAEVPVRERHLGAGSACIVLLRSTMPQ